MCKKCNVYTVVRMIVKDRERPGPEPEESLRCDAGKAKVPTGHRQEEVHIKSSILVIFCLYHQIGRKRDTDRAKATSQYEEKEEIVSWQLFAGRLVLFPRILCSVCELLLLLLAVWFILLFCVHARCITRKRVCVCMWLNE